MNLTKLRQEKGWSQEELAMHSGLSVRTIQRVESGKTASLETLKCLAAVFETSIADLMKEPEMPKTQSNYSLSTDYREKDALDHVKNLKAFYTHILVFVVVMPCIAALNYVLSPGVWWYILVIIPWVLAIILQAVTTLSFFNFLGPKWEQRQFKKRMDE